MEKFIKIAVNVTKYGALTTDKNGNQWLNISGYLKEEKDKYGNNGFVKRNTMQGEKHQDMPIVGNFQVVEFNKPAQQIPNGSDDLPFTN